MDCLKILIKLIKQIKYINFANLKQHVILSSKYMEDD